MVMIKIVLLTRSKLYNLDNILGEKKIFLSISGRSINETEYNLHIMSKKHHNLKLIRHIEENKLPRNKMHQ